MTEKIRASEKRFIPRLRRISARIQGALRGGISSIFTARSNAVAGPSDKQGWDKSLFSEAQNVARNNNGYTRRDVSMPNG
jgi:hypothetical protein